MPLFDRKDKSRYATFTRRTLVVSGGMTAVLCALGGRLYQLQIRDGALYRTAAEDNRVNERLVAPPRGRVLDRFGIELANNRRNYRLLLIAEQVNGKTEAALDTIARVIALNDQQKKRVLRDLAANKKFVPVVVAENLSWDEFALINQHLPYLPGVQPDVGETRAYPFGAELSHLLGYVAQVSVADKQKAGDDDPLLDLPGFRIGKQGIEKQFDAEVRGEAGASRVEVNAYGRVIRELSSDPATPGKDIYLTIDRELQHFTDQRLGIESCACVVMDCQTGDVLAFSSTPGFDPNVFNVGIPQDMWNALMSDDHKPMLNKVLSGLYPPGSTFKPAVAVAAVEAGLDGLTVNCTGSLTLGNYEFHCWKKGGHGHVDLKRGIQASCDVFFYETARRLGIDRIESAARKLGLGAVTGIELPNEQAGVIPGAAWKLAKYGIPWQQGETLNTGIGQGYVLVTPIQLCTQAARIASGKAILPRIAHVVGNLAQPKPVPEPLPFSDKTFTLVREGMNAVCNEPGGTAFPWRITQEGFEMAGKTGTAQVRKISKEEHASGVKKNESLPWKLRDHALFIAFAPATAPRYAAAIVMEHGAVGAHPHVQMVRDILLFAQQRNVLGLRTAYPVSAASAEPAAGAHMTTRAYAAARRTLTLVDKLYEINWGLVLLITLIACVGFAMLYSVAGASFSPWAGKQMVFFAAGLFFMIAAALIDIRWWMSIAYPAYGVSLILLVIVLAAGHSALGAQRWLMLGPLELQPSELMKLALILALARYLHGLSIEDVSKPTRLLIPIMMIAMPAFLVLKQPNLGTTIILAADGISLLFLAGLSWWWIAPALGAVATAIPLAWRFFLHDYQKARVMTFLNPESDALGAGWNITQAKIAIGSGGLTGKGYLQGSQSRLNFLPEKHSDFIITNFGEEFGFVGSIALLLLFAIVIGYGIQIAMAARSQFGRLVAMGIVLNFFFYILINGAMVMGLIPVVGIPMPLVSYGGTAMLTVMFGFGLLMSVHVHRQVEIPRHSGGII